MAIYGVTVLLVLPRLDQHITNRIDATAGEDCVVTPRSAMTEAGSLDTDGSGRQFLPSCCQTRHRCTVAAGTCRF